MEDALVAMATIMKTWHYVSYFSSSLRYLLIKFISILILALVIIAVAMGTMGCHGHSRLICIKNCAITIICLKHTPKFTPIFHPLSFNSHLLPTGALTNQPQLNLVGRYHSNGRGKGNKIDVYDLKQVYTCLFRPKTLDSKWSLLHFRSHTTVFGLNWPLRWLRH